MSKEINWLLQEKYNGEKSEGFFVDCKRLEAGEPLAYIIGSIPFLNTTIYLDSKPLIPRPETEFWVEKAILHIQARIQSSDYNHRDSIPMITTNPEVKTPVRGLTPYLQILDLCAGSGAVGVAVGKAILEARVTFGEIDPLHLPTIKKNITENLSVNRKVLEDQYNIVVGNLFESISGTFDFILANPPYIDAKAHTVEKSVTDNEPTLALFGGHEGFEIIERIIKQAKKYLNPAGQLWIEHEPAQGTSVERLATSEGYSSTVHKDQYDIERYSVLMIQ